jgi:outer membrane autotransporter protein
MGHFGDVGGDGNAHGFNSTTGGGTAGLEHGFGEDVTAGGALGYVHSDFALTGVSQNGSFDQVALGGYAEKRWGRWFADGAVALGYDHLDGTRHIGFLGRTATGSDDGFAAGILAKGGARYHLEPSLMLEPSVSLLYSHVDAGSLTETGANAADLAVASSSEDKVQSILGAKMTQRIDVDSGAVKPALRLGWAHEFTNPHTSVKESFVAIPASGFSLTGASTGRDLALLGASVTYETMHRWSVYARGDAALGERVHDFAVTAGFRVTW